MAEENCNSIIPVQVKDRLPQVLEEEVQLRLPVKSLVRFKSVCKQWRSRFESRRFIALYDERHPRGIYNNFSSESRTSSFQELIKMVPGLDRMYDGTRIGDGFWGRNFFVYGPLSNGIYCLTSHHMRKSNGCCPILSAKIALCNPATGQYKFADPFPREFRDMLSETSPNSFTHSPSRLYYGFGSVYKVNSSSETLDYRVIVIIHYGSRMPYSFLVFVYSFQRRKWRKIVEYRAGRRKIGKPKATDAFDLQGRRINDIFDPLETCHQGFFKGCYHWVVTHQVVDSFSVLAFNFADQSFKLMRGPPYHRDAVVDERVYVMDNGSSFVLHDHLALIRHFDVTSSSSGNLRAMQTVEIGVWMMMEYGVEESWARIYTINPDFNCFLNGLDGIDYEANSDDGGGGIHIKRLLLTIGHDDDDKLEITSFDNDGGHQVITSAGSRVPLSFHTCADDLVAIINTVGKASISWSTPGISTYIETLERL